MTVLCIEIFIGLLCPRIAIWPMPHLSQRVLKRSFSASSTPSRCHSCLTKFHGTANIWMYSMQPLRYFMHQKHCFKLDNRGANHIWFLSMLVWPKYWSKLCLQKQSDKIFTRCFGSVWSNKYAFYWLLTQTSRRSRRRPCGAPRSRCRKSPREAGGEGWRSTCTGLKIETF